MATKTSIKQQDVQAGVGAEGSADGKKGKTFEVGDKMEDGTIFAGVSPDTGRNMFVTPKDASGVFAWKAAMKYAANLDANGHRDWSLPTEAELKTLYQNRNKGALKGTFNTSGTYPSSFYWSSAQTPVHPDPAFRVLFSNGSPTWMYKGSDASVRPVRSEICP